MRRRFQQRSVLIPSRVQLEKVARRRHVFSHRPLVVSVDDAAGVPTQQHVRLNDGELCLLSALCKQLQVREVVASPGVAGDDGQVFNVRVSCRRNAGRISVSLLSCPAEVFITSSVAGSLRTIAVKIGAQHANQFR